MHNIIVIKYTLISVFLKQNIKKSESITHAHKSIILKNSTLIEIEFLNTHAISKNK
jgi:hypothetical protein